MIAFRAECPEGVGFRTRIAEQMFIIDGDRKCAEIVVVMIHAIVTAFEGGCHFYLSIFRRTADQELHIIKPLVAGVAILQLVGLLPIDRVKHIQHERQDVLLLLIVEGIDLFISGPIAFGIIVGAIIKPVGEPIDGG